MMTIEEYLEKPYWVVDILPKQVPENSGGQYFRIEGYYLEHPRIDALYEHFTNILLKLNCYDDIDVSSDGEEWTMNPSPNDIAKMVQHTLTSRGMLYFILQSEDTMITITGYDTYMTVYHPSEDVLELLGDLSTAEGLFLWKPSTDTLSAE